MTKDQFNQAVVNTIARYPGHFDITMRGNYVNFDEYVIFNPSMDGKIYHSIIYKPKFRELSNDIRVFFDEQLKDVVKAN